MIFVYSRYLGQGEGTVGPGGAIEALDYMAALRCIRNCLHKRRGKGVTRGYKKKAFSQEVRLLACSLKTISACRKKYSLLFSWPRKADTLIKPAEKRREA